MSGVPVCRPCRRRMRCQQNETLVAIDGVDGPYKQLHGDTYRCEGCGHEVVTGFGREVERHTTSWSSREPDVVIK